jgi:hypothetical protein
MAESTLATFRVDKELWIKFQELVKSRETNASKVMVGLIEACMDNRLDPKTYTVITPNSEGFTQSIDRYLDKHLHERTQAIAETYLDKNLEDRLGEYLDVYLDKYLDTHIGSYLDKFEMGAKKGGLSPQVPSDE